MDILTVLTYICAVVETGALLLSLVFVTKAVKEKKANKGKSTPARKDYYKKAFAFIFVYLVLNMVRNFGLLG